MKTVKVRLGGRSYPVWIGGGLLRVAGRLLARRFGVRRLFVCSSAPVRRLHGRTLSAACRAGRIELRWIGLPDGERAKTLAVLGRTLRRLAGSGAGRSATIAAFGGGSVGDTAGFAAAVYARGVRFVQIPTTLEAQVDAAIGGKTAVDLPEGKNLAGAFHQPLAVVSDPRVLDSLPRRQLIAGLAEVVKYGVIASAPLFARLERNAERLKQGDSRELEAAVVASSRIKAAIVSEDERESGRRLALNFGHTLGHAIEAAAGFRRVLHGEGVAMGMVQAMRWSVRLGLCRSATAARVERLLVRLGLPVTPPAGLTRARLIRAMLLDKKRVDDGLRVVLCRTIGDVTVRTGLKPRFLLDGLGPRG